MAALTANKTQGGRSHEVSNRWDGSHRSVPNANGFGLDIFASCAKFSLDPSRQVQLSDRVCSNIQYLVFSCKLNPSNLSRSKQWTDRRNECLLSFDFLSKSLRGISHEELDAVPQMSSSCQGSRGTEEQLSYSRRWWGGIVFEMGILAKKASIDNARCLRGCGDCFEDLTVRDSLLPSWTLDWGVFWWHVKMLIKERRRRGEMEKKKININPGRAESNSPKGNYWGVLYHTIPNT